ncbi:hypothetical protein FSARC_14848 [Fusarium sarcochroum]|uniref:Ubiquitin-like domain-containing protein n=1 Tax=Fusarium sarcochroum TaxID=1208366 RepID=A0A8H4WN38_9HYPO|nr:hypothetical protein FSARC_14848 [Fusarium sarcochroum]
MSFGYAVGDVIAVLGLFERIAIELRNYKDSPTHFQQLRVELDLVHSTLKHVLLLEPECPEDRQTIERIRAIVIHCSQHANAIADHASNILTIASRTQSTVDALTVDVAIQGDAHSKQAKALNQNLAAIETNMLDLTRKTGKASAMVRRQAAFVSRHAKTLFRFMQDMKELFTMLAQCSKEMLESIARNTRMLLNISGQLKHIVRAIEAIPLHLTLDIVRLDDAHGESWALPLQARGTWQSFHNLLQLVVYANGRHGVNHIMRNQFAITSAKTGLPIGRSAWTQVVRLGLHIE